MATKDPALANRLAINQYNLGNRTGSGGYLGTTTGSFAPRGYNASGSYFTGSPISVDPDNPESAYRPMVTKADQILAYADTGAWAPTPEQQQLADITRQRATGQAITPEQFQGAEIGPIDQSLYAPQTMETGGINAANLATLGALGQYNVGQMQGQESRVGQQFATQLAGQQAFQAQLAAARSTGEQYSALGLQRAAALGEAPSVAENLMRSGLDEQARQALSVAASARGGVGAQMLARREAIGQNTIAGQELINKMAALRASEMEAARGSYLSGASTARATDVNEIAASRGALLSGTAQQRASDMAAASTALEAGQLGLGLSEQQRAIASQNLGVASETQAQRNAAIVANQQQQAELAQQAAMQNTTLRAQAGQYNAAAQQAYLGTSLDIAEQNRQNAISVQQARLNAAATGLGYQNAANIAGQQAAAARYGANQQLIGAVIQGGATVAAQGLSSRGGSGGTTNNYYGGSGGYY
jgi:hypothetical protein